MKTGISAAPGLTEAVEAGKWDAAKQQARLLEQALQRNTALLRQALR